MSQTELLSNLNEFSDEENDSGKPPKKKLKSKSSFSNILHLIFSQLSFNRIFKLTDITNILCNPMFIKPKSKHVSSILQVMDILREKLTATNFGDELDSSSMNTLRNTLEPTDLSIMSITSGTFNEVAEAWQLSLTQFIPSQPASSSCITTASPTSTLSMPALTAMDVADVGPSGISRNHRRASPVPGTSSSHFSPRTTSAIWQSIRTLDQDVVYVSESKMDRCSSVVQIKIIPYKFCSTNDKKRWWMGAKKSVVFSLKEGEDMMVAQHLQFVLTAAERIIAKGKDFQEYQRGNYSNTIENAINAIIARAKADERSGEVPPSELKPYVDVEVPTSRGLRPQEI